MEAVIVGGLLALTGLFLIISAVRDADFLYQPPVKATGKLIHGIVYNNFGKRGIRNLALICGSVVFLSGSFMMYLPYSQGLPSALRSTKSRPNVHFVGLLNNPINPDEIREAPFSLAMDIREAPLTLNDKDVFEGTVTNANLREIPRKIWNMKRLRSLNVSNNKLAKINTDSLAKLDSLRLLTLTNNPFDTAYIEGLRKQFPLIEIVF